MPNVGVQGRTRVGDIEPPLVPTLQRCLEMKAKILFALPLAELKTSAPNYIDLAILQTRLEDKEVMEEIEVGANAKKDFTEVDEGGDMKN